MAVNHDDTCNPRACFSASSVHRTFPLRSGTRVSITGVPCYVAELSPKALRGLFVVHLGLALAQGFYSFSCVELFQEPDITGYR